MGNVPPVNRPLIAAHRGASKAEKANTLDAFRAARRLGADMVELDVRRTEDRQLVVHHDPHVGLKAIIRMRAEDLPTYVPTLADALDACEGMQVNIEIKSDGSEPDYDPRQGVAEAVVSLLEQRGDGERMLVSSFDRDTIDRVHALAPELRTGLLFEQVWPDAARMMRELAAAGHVAAHPYRKAVDAALVEAAHANDLQVIVWTVDKPAEMQLLAGLGVDTIITNVPDVARTALGLSDG
jgi:glycerophosphoryl diester phosphodiesterase